MRTCSGLALALVLLAVAPASAQDEAAAAGPDEASSDEASSDEASSDEASSEPSATDRDDAADEFDDIDAELGDVAASEPAPPGEAPALDPVNAAEFEEIERFMGVEQRTGTWELDDEIGPEEVEWDDYDRDSSYLPRGLVHVGVGARVAAMPGGGEGLPAPDGPMIELSFLADFRYSQTGPWRMRLALAVNYQPYGEGSLGAGARVSQSPFAIRLRVMPLSFDIGRWVGIRLGPDVGIQWAPGSGGNGGQMTFLAGATTELVLNLLDGLLEVGLVGGMQLTAVGRSDRTGYGTAIRPEGMVGATAGYFFE